MIKLADIVRGSTRCQRGSASVEMIVMTSTILIPLFCFVVFCGRISSVPGDVQSAARMASRAATLERTVDGQRARGEDAARQRLESAGIQCAGGPNVTVNVLPYQGRSGLAVSTVSCTVAYSDSGFPGLPGSHTFSASFSEFFDVRRESE
jgi:hypothetical protein